MRFLFVIHDLHEPNSSIPLGPAYVAQALREDGVDVDFFCQDVTHAPDDDLETRIREGGYDAVGINFLAARFNRIGETLSAIRRACNRTGAMMILGGHGPSPIPEFMLRRTGADVAVIGEGEATAVALMRAVGSGVSLAGVDGIAWTDGEGRPRRLIADLDRIAFPAYDLLPMDRYTRKQAGRHSQELDRVVYGNMITSRGCVGRCSFCYRMDKGLRLRSIDNIIAEMSLLHDEYGVNYFAFQDETLAASARRITEFCRSVCRLSFAASWSTGIRVDMIQDSETARMLTDSGCVYLSLGLESLDQEALDQGMLDGPADFFDKFKNSDYVTVNFTDMTTEAMIDALFAANCEIIDNFCDHPKVRAGGRYFSTDRDRMKKLFHDLYYDGFYEFRGVR